MEGTDFMNFKVSIPQDKIKGGEQSGGPSAILCSQLSWDCRRVSQDAHTNQKKWGCLLNTDLPTGAGASAQLPDLTWAGRNSFLR